VPKTKFDSLAVRDILRKVDKFRHYYLATFSLLKIPEFDGSRSCLSDLSVCKSIREWRSPYSRTWSESHMRLFPQSLVPNPQSLVPRSLAIKNPRLGCKANRGN
jgi:hypothetical protein